LLVREKKLTAWQAQQIYSGKGKTLLLGNYLVLDKLGQGGMGVVLRAEHRRMGRQVALKVLSPAITKSPDALRRFQRQRDWRRLLAQFGNPPDRCHSAGNRGARTETVTLAPRAHAK